MSLFRRPKKGNIQRRVFSALDEDDDENTRKTENEASTSHKSSRNGDSSSKMDVDERCKTPPPPNISHKHEKKSKDPSKSDDKKSSKKSSLLSFGDDEDEDEVFQVKKTSHSKKVMKMLDKERRRKKLREKDGHGTNDNGNNDRHSKTNNGFNNKTNACDVVQATSYETMSDKGIDHDDNNLANKKRQKSSQISNSSIHTEIRTDDFVLVVKKTEPEPNIILNGRAAFCAGRDDMSSEDESESKADGGHRFKRPDNFRSLLESGAIPDAAMIHEARKKRQQARELGDFVALEEKPVDNRKGRLVREEAEDDASDDERVDMSAITGSKEREERREKFYSIQHGSDEDSDQDLNEWESQQIRKAISGSTLMNAQQEAYSHFLIKDGSNGAMASPTHFSTGNLLEQAYASTHFEKTKTIKLSKKSEKKTGPRMPHEIRNSLEDRLKQVKELNAAHLSQIDEITKDIKILGLGEVEAQQTAPVAAAKYRFYQELKGYVLDLIDCFDEKVPKIVELEKKYYVAMERYWNYCVERRRRDVTEQAREITQAQKPTNTAPMSADARRLEERRAQRAAEREGRRTRRRRDRERIDIRNTHLDGMSSDDEVPDQEATLYKNQLKQISAEATLIFEDASEEFCELPDILKHFEEWRNRDMTSYKDTYFSLCLPKIVGPIVRLNMITWNLLDENCKDIEKMEWYDALMKYGYKSNETEAELADDSDIRLVPTVVERFILPKITECIQKAWDPCSSTQTLRLVNLLRRLIRDYPSLKPTSKYMKTMFTAIFDKMRLSLDSDVFIPYFPNQSKEGKSSFFQRQFSSALKLFRNLLSWEGILSDSALKEIAISSLLNRYLLSAIRICAPIDAIAKSHIIVNTMPRVWLQQNSIIESMDLFIQFIRSLSKKIDLQSPLHGDAVEKLTQLFGTFHLPLTMDYD